MEKSHYLTAASPYWITKAQISLRIQDFEKNGPVTWIGYGLQEPALVGTFVPI